MQIVVMILRREIKSEVYNMIRYLPISKYCRDFGDTVEAVNKRVQRGIWAEGVHVFKIQGMRERQIDIVAVDEWKNNEKQKCRVA